MKPQTPPVREMKEVDLLAYECEKVVTRDADELLKGF